jgi:3-oxoisoapionate kinase
MTPATFATEKDATRPRPRPRRLPAKNQPRLLVAYYGDDFTGSTDVLEALAVAGVRTALFLKPPTPKQLARFPGLRAFGIAGASRTMSPREMDQALPPIFRALHRSGAVLAHYKICSTFDSSPEVGSIGHVIDLAQRTFHSPTVPLVVGAPVLGRYCVFGNLFARSGLDSEPHRLDRHPTMQRHPITPMDESDLRLHLGKQTRRTIELFDVLKLASADVELVFRKITAKPPGVLLFDVLDESHLPVVGKMIWNYAQAHAPLFAVGSSGLEYALTAHWRGERPSWSVKPVQQTVAISGSCSPVTARQIALAFKSGFSGIPLDPVKFIDPQKRDREVSSAVTECVRLIQTGRSVILHTSLGPDDPRVAATHRALTRAGLSPGDQRLKLGRLVGPLLGTILRMVTERVDLRRLVVAGGDTSWFVANELRIEALGMAGPMAPGSPLCRIHSANPAIHGREIVFKGGQVGRDDFFTKVLHTA